MIKKISNSYSTGVADEIIATKKQELEYLHMIETSFSANDYIYHKSSPSIGAKEFEHILKKSGKQLKVLDIGVGGGQSTVYLALAGHNVSCIEPSPTFCNVIETAAKKFSLNINIYLGVAEDMLNIQDRDFDYIFFNASFHHCDDPKKTLDNTFMLLKEGGKVVLATENFLRIWDSKKHWYYLLEHHPEKIGHYGGNEHIYYNWQYHNFLKESHFNRIKLVPSIFTYSPVMHVGYVINTGVVKGQLSVLIRFMYYILVAFLLKNPAVFSFFSRWSMSQCTFIATK